MSKGAYYNENDPFAAQWLRNLIEAGHLPAGDVDDRSIVAVRPSDLAGYGQCHFFAGIGGWPHALGLAGWPESRPIWTGSCPCQPFSNAGKRGGADDPRHLWPDFLRLIRAAWPAVVMGEQVAGAAGYGWFDGVRVDLAGEGYACRGVDIPACALDAPHIRNRLYWVAVADAHRGGRGGWTEKPERQAQRGAAVERPDGVEHAAGERRGEGQSQSEFRGGRRATPASADVSVGANGAPSFWSDVEWIACHDGKARRTKPGIPMLAHGVRGRVAVGGALGGERGDQTMGRVGVWKGLGNAVVPQQAEQVIRAFMEAA